MFNSVRQALVGVFNKTCAFQIGRITRAIDAPIGRDNAQQIMRAFRRTTYLDTIHSRYSQFAL